MKVCVPELPKKSCRESWEMIHICSPGFQRAYSQLARRLAASSRGPTCGQEARGGRPLTHSRRELACGLRLVPVLLPRASPHSSTTLFFSSFSSPSSFWLFPYIWTQRVFTSRMYVDFWSPLIQLTKRKWKHSIFFFFGNFIYIWNWKTFEESSTSLWKCRLWENSMHFPNFYTEIADVLIQMFCRFGEVSPHMCVCVCSSSTVMQMKIPLITKGAYKHTPTHPHICTSAHTQMKDLYVLQTSHSSFHRHQLLFEQNFPNVLFQIDVGVSVSAKHKSLYFFTVIFYIGH